MKTRGTVLKVTLNVFKYMAEKLRPYINYTLNYVLTDLFRINKKYKV